MDTNGFSGGGYAIYRGANLLKSSSARLRSSVEVYDAEIAAAVTGAQVAMEIAEASLAENINVCLDNEAASIILAEKYKNTSSYNYIIQFADLKKKWRSRPRGFY